MLTEQQKNEIIEYISRDDESWEVWLNLQPKELQIEIGEFVNQLFFPDTEPTPTQED